MTTVAAASSALGGLVLVFLGVVIAGYSSYDGDTAASVLSPFRWGAAGILATFALSLLSTGLAVAWLATKTGAGALYESMLWSFVALLVTLLVMAVVTVYRVVLT
ncbi:MAG: hypothetical protein WAU42_08895 [Solirubrobacteraceae bacterium]